MTTSDEPIWLRHYRAHPRSRFYALDDEAERDLATLWLGSGNRDDFYYALESLTDGYGMKLVRPVARAKPEVPKPRLDSLGRPLANPFETGNVKEQRVLKTLDPELAVHLEALATRPYEYSLELEQREAARLRRNKIEAEYLHSENVFVHGSKDDQIRFIRETAEEPERKEIYLRETEPVRLNMFGPVQSQDAHARTVQHQVWHDGDARLQRIIRAGQNARKAADIAEHERAEAERAEAVRAHEAQRKAHADLIAGVKRTPSGQIITMPG